MGSIFAGLVQVGAWGCFDEFNRINIEVLSVVSAQLKAIQNSLISGKPTVDIGVGGEIKIKRVAGFATCGVFITMNPGYAGRTELPDNLKALFRPVTMIVPDLLQICEIMLFSEGFEAAKVRKNYPPRTCLAREVELTELTDYLGIQSIVLTGECWHCAPLVALTSTLYRT